MPTAALARGSGAALVLLGLSGGVGKALKALDLWRPSGGGVRPRLWESAEGLDPAVLVWRDPCPLTRHSVSCGSIVIAGLEIGLTCWTASIPPLEGARNESCGSLIIAGLEIGLTCWTTSIPP